jgi:carboxymethylenebutenolidase
MIVFDGANHAFFNDAGERFNPEAAEGAWSDTLEWFDQYL